MARKKRRKSVQDPRNCSQKFGQALSINLSNGGATSLGARVREVFAWGEATMFLRVFSSLASSSSRRRLAIRSVLIRTTACEHRPPWGAPGWRTDQPVCFAPPLLQSSCRASPFLLRLLLPFCGAPDIVFRHGRSCGREFHRDALGTSLNYLFLYASKSVFLLLLRESLKF